MNATPTLPAAQNGTVDFAPLAGGRKLLLTSIAYNLLAVYQAQVTPQSGWRKPLTLRTAVFICGAVLGRIGRKIVLRLSQTGGSLAKSKALIDKVYKPPEPIAQLLVRQRPPATIGTWWHQVGAPYDHRSTYLNQLANAAFGLNKGLISKFN